MLLLFLSFITLKNIINVHRIDNANTTIYVIWPQIHQDDHKAFDMYYKQLASFFDLEFKQIQIVNFSYSEWMSSYKIHLPMDNFNLALFRFNHFVEFYSGIVERNYLRKYLKLAELSHIICIKEKEIPNIIKTKKQFFILHNDHIYYEYENTAFEYKYTDITFYFVQGPFSLNFYDNINHKIRQYDFSRKIASFIKSCASIKEEISNDDFEAFEQLNDSSSFGSSFKSKNMFSLYAITNSLNSNQNVHFYLSSINKSIHHYGKSSIVDWNSSISKTIQKMCMIKPNQITYSLLYHYNKTYKCWFYPYETINNQELFNNFFISIIQNTFMKTYILHDITKKTQKEESALLRLVPNKQFIVVAFISNPDSSSVYRFHEAYQLLKYRLSYFKRIKFVSITEKEYNKLPSYFPHTDGFPMIVLWEPMNKFPHIFMEPFTNENLINFVLKYVKN